MEFSNYLMKLPCDQQAGNTILYSTKKASIVRIPDEMLDEIEAGEISESDQEALVSLKMLVKDRQAEIQSMTGYFDNVNAESERLAVTAVLNFDCNFGCVYCYEGDLKGKRYMSKETAEKFVEFVRKKFTPEKKKLIVALYGGEPLLSMGLVNTISRSLREFTESRGAALEIHMVSNGSLLTRKVAKQLRDIGLKNIRITLDGPAELHDRTRPFKSGAGSFNVIIDNIEQACDLITISLGGNFQKDNFPEFVRLLDYLEDRGLGSDKISGVKFDPVMQQPGPDNPAASCYTGCASLNEPWIPDADRLLRKEILTRGYKLPKPGPIHCMIETADDIVVNYDGSIYKCPGFLGMKEFVAGHIETGIEDYTAAYNPGVWKNDECLACRYLPICFGGCRYMSYMKEGVTNKVECAKPYFDASLQTIIMDDIRYRKRPPAE